MITIIHGDDIDASRAHYLTLRQKKEHILILDGAKLDKNILLSSISGADLFGQSPIVFIENLFKEKQESEVLELIKTGSKTTEIILWEDKEISKKDEALFEKPQIVVFKLPKTIFKFLDSVGPSNKTLPVLFHQTLQTTPVELLMAMLIKRFRLLIFLQEKNYAQLEESKRLADWQLSRLTSQAKLFTKEQLLKNYKKLFSIDLKAKTGASSMNLVPSLDYFFLEL